MSNEANGGGMSRVEALEAVAEAARQVCNARADRSAEWTDVTEAIADMQDAIRALDALPADPEPARGEVVEMELWRHTAGDAVLVIPGSAVSKELAEARHRTRLGTTRLPLVKRAGA